MSHACVLVAVDVVNPNDRAEVEAAVQFQMEPYDANGILFRDGSRWDWYQIGGRCSGMLFPDYKASEDPRNSEVCELCAGTGIRPEGLAQFGQAWYDRCNGCNGCHGTGKALKHPGFWVPFDGDIIQLKELKGKPVPAAYAFLRNRHWHEPERLGWFGCATATECELKDPDNLDVAANKCVTTGDENAIIVVWNEPWELWKQKFLHRFIEPLPPETVLVVVDYHV